MKNSFSYPRLVNATDLDLIRAVSENRSQQALETLYRRHRPLLQSVIGRVMNSESDVDDVLQDVFIQVWNQASAYSSEKGHLLGWLITLARRRALDRVRQMCAYRNATVRYENSVEPPRPGSLGTCTVDKEVQHHELQERMSTLMHRLPEAQRQVVRLTFYQGLSQREIAAHLSVPLGTIKTRIELGMRKLGRSLLAEQAAA